MAPKWLRTLRDWNKDSWENWPMVDSAYDTPDVSGFDHYGYFVRSCVHMVATGEVDHMDFTPSQVALAHRAAADSPHLLAEHTKYLASRPLDFD
jgi:hypothetical protein